MSIAEVFVHNIRAGQLIEIVPKRAYRFEYATDYHGPPVSPTMPVTIRAFSFEQFPSFFEGVLPEGIMLEGLIRGLKIDRDDYFSQLLATGGDLVGAVTVKPLHHE